MLDEDTAVVVITDIVITESVVAAAVVRKGTAVNGLMSSKGTSLCCRHWYRFHGHLMI